MSLLNALSDSSTEIPSFLHVLLLAKDDQYAKEDRKLLRRTGFQTVQVMSSGVKALEYLFKLQKIKAQPSIIFCQEQLEDMDASTFLSIFSLHPYGKIFPILILCNDPINTLEHSEEFKLDFLENRQLKYESLGSFASLAHPLTPHQITLAAIKAHTFYNNAFTALVSEQKKYAQIQNSPTSSQEQKSALLNYHKERKHFLDTFEATLLKYSFIDPKTLSFSESYDKACKKLQNRVYGQALQYFQRAASAQSELKGDALLGISQIYLEKKDLKNTLSSLSSAFQSYIEKQQWAKLQEAIQFSAQNSLKPYNPILDTLSNSIKMGQYDNTQGILAALIPVQNENIKLEETCTAIAKACHSGNLSLKMAEILRPYEEVFDRVFDLLKDEQESKERTQQLRQQSNLRKRTDSLSMVSTAPAHKHKKNTQNEIQNTRLYANDTLGSEHHKKLSEAIEESLEFTGVLPLFPLESNSADDNTLNDSFVSDFPLSEKKQSASTQKQSNIKQKKQEKHTPLWTDKTKAKHNSFFGDILQVFKHIAKNTDN